MSPEATSESRRTIAWTSEGGAVSERMVNGIRLYYEEHGDGDPILLIHGTSSSALVWGRPSMSSQGSDE